MAEYYGGELDFARMKNATNDFLGEDGMQKGNAVLASTPQLYAPLKDLLKISS